MTYNRQALTIARELQYQSGASFNLNSIAEIYLARGQWLKARTTCQEAIEIADSISFVQVQHEARVTLALVELFNEDLLAARTVIEAALTYKRPDKMHNAMTLRGVIALRQGDTEVASIAFCEALAQCISLLKLVAKNQGVLYAQGLARAGLALLTEDAALIDLAEKSYLEAKAITATPGVIAEQTQRLDALMAADTSEMLAKLRTLSSDRTLNKGSEKADEKANKKWVSPHLVSGQRGLNAAR